MLPSKNEKVQQFLDDLKRIDAESFDVVEALRKIVFQTFPEPSEKMMYGGIIFQSTQEMKSGVFVYKNHVSIEFSNGYLMKDPSNLLEGKGKFRRHIKIRTFADIDDKNVPFFVQQAF